MSKYNRVRSTLNIIFSRCHSEHVGEIGLSQYPGYRSELATRWMEDHKSYKRAMKLPHLRRAGLTLSRLSDYSEVMKREEFQRDWWKIDSVTLNCASLCQTTRYSGFNNYINRRLNQWFDLENLRFVWEDQISSAYTDARVITFESTETAIYRPFIVLVKRTNWNNTISSLLIGHSQ